MRIFAFLIFAMIGPASFGQNRGVLGVELAETPEGYAFVQRVFDGTPALLAGIRPGDIIIGMNGYQLHVTDLRRHLANNPNNRVTIHLFRRGVGRLDFPIVLVSAASVERQPVRKLPSPSYLRNITESIKDLNSGPCLSCSDQ